MIAAEGEMSIRGEHRLGSWVKLVRPGRRAGETANVSSLMVRPWGVIYGVTWWDCSESYHRAEELTAAWPSADPDPTD